MTCNPRGLRWSAIQDKLVRAGFEFGGRHEFHGDIHTTGIGAIRKLDFGPYRCAVTNALDPCELERQDDRFAAVNALEAVAGVGARRRQKNDEHIQQDSSAPWGDKLTGMSWARDHLVSYLLSLPERILNREKIS